MNKDFRKYYISIAGGLGNQMLSYSLWYYLTYVKKKKDKAISNHSRITRSQ